MARTPISIAALVGAGIISDTGGGVPQAYSRSTDYVFGVSGMRWPNKNQGLGAGFTKFGGYLSGWKSAPWSVPAGSTMLVGIPNHRNFEGNATINEALIANDATIEAVSVQYQDADGTNRIATAAGFSNGGVLSSTLANGGVIASIPIAFAMPALAALKLGLAFSTVDNGELLSCYDLRSGDIFRKHATSSFAAAINTGAAPTTVSGNASGSISGFYPGPAFICVVGADGRPIFYIDGDSIAYGKGTPEVIAPNHVSGIVEPALVSIANDAYVIPSASGTVAGSGYAVTDPANGAYNPNIHQHRRALIDQVAAMNGGRPPFTHHLCEHLTNSIMPTSAEAIALIKTRHVWLKAWHNLPIIQTSGIQKVTSSDGFTSYAGQTPNGDADVRSAFRDKVMSDGLDGSAIYGVDTYGPLAFDTTLEGRKRFALRPFTATLTRDLAASGTTVYLSAAPAIGASLFIGNRARIVLTVTTITPGVEYQVTTDVGSTSGNYPATLTGGVANEIPTSDGNPATDGLHISKISNDNIAAAIGTNSFVAMKAMLKAAVSGAWVA